MVEKCSFRRKWTLSLISKVDSGVSCKKITVNENSSARRTRQNRLMLVSNCVRSRKKKSRSIKNQETSRLELH